MIIAIAKVSERRENATIRAQDAELCCHYSKNADDTTKIWSLYQLTHYPWQTNLGVGIFKYLAQIRRRQ